MVPTDNTGNTGNYFLFPTTQQHIFMSSDGLVQFESIYKHLFNDNMITMAFTFSYLNGIGTAPSSFKSS